MGGKVPSSRGILDADDAGMALKVGRMRLSSATRRTPLDGGHQLYPRTAVDP